MRSATVSILDYAEAMNADMKKEGNFKPFGDMWGFKGLGHWIEKHQSAC